MVGTEHLNNYNSNRLTILDAIKHYRDELTTLVEDEEIESGGDRLLIGTSTKYCPDDRYLLTPARFESRVAQHDTVHQTPIII